MRLWVWQTILCRFYRWKNKLRQTSKVVHFLSAFWPKAQRVNAREKWRICVGAFFGIFLAGFLATYLSHHFHGLLAVTHQIWLIAPLGASAVLVFAVPNSPLAQPWSVVGGNTVSALVGIACVYLLPDPLLAASMAVALAITCMFALRCLHPPGGASALLMVLAGIDHFSYAFMPVFVNSLLLVLVGLLYHHLSGKRWPFALAAAPAPAPSQSQAMAKPRFSQEDLDAALVRYNQVVAMNTEDLVQLLQSAQANAYQRTLGELRCRDVMTSNLHSISPTVDLKQAWALMREHHVKALPVVDAQQHLLGIVTTADFMKQVDLDVHEGLAWRLRSLVHGQKQKRLQRTVQEIMSVDVQAAHQDLHLVDAIALFTMNDHRHMPIVDDAHRLVGILTQSDLVRALYQACSVQNTD